MNATTDWIAPASLDEALAARAAHPDYVVLAGGTDLMVGALDRAAPRGVIDVFGLRGLCDVAVESDGSLAIGAGVTYARLLEDASTRRVAPALVAAAREVGAMQIQARATLGGNVGTSSPVGDTLPVLLALDARVRLASPRAVREIPYDRFCTGYRTHALADDELIVAVVLPADAGRRRQAWRKVGTRRAQSISKVMMAAAAEIDVDGVVREARLAFGAVADRPIRVREAEARLAGRAPDTTVADAVGAAVAAAIAPIDDVRSEAAYRAAVARRLARRFVLSLAATDVTRA